MRAARFRTAFVALAASASLVLAGTGVAQAAPATKQAPAAAPAASTLSTPVTGTFTDALGSAGTFTGTFTPTRFVNQNGQLAAVGTLTGTLTNSVGTSLGAVSQQVTTPVQVSGTCDILNLDLGPLDLNLLGLKVHLNEVVLDITAQQGPGNLLGNLLCAVAGLLDGTGGVGGALNGLVALLNRILGAL
ncbi:hypothetical protein [Micromonospora auratinigra]|uniref:ABC transporter substrate-binding protein n=1 Tax=Micromonospora auratinigra TaxID=261654 RepID=A0A1A8ZYE5_9ACTN|nr:hypothetical protein [Micromonospora auratinigra]SBT49174.1 hypothetical protein GA0070611_4312 [Micromonospora auratinigra]